MDNREIILQMLQTNLLNDGLEYCDFQNPTLTGKSENICQGHVARSIAFSRLRDALITSHANLEIGPNSYGRIVFASSECFPSLSNFFYFTRHTDMTDWWQKVGIDFDKEYSEPIFHTLTTSIKGNQCETELKALADRMLVIACSLQRDTFDRVLQLAKFEEKYNLPSFKEKYKNTEWARDIRFKLLKQDKISLKKAQKIKSTNAWIKYTKFKPIPKIFNTYPVR